MTAKYESADSVIFHEVHTLFAGLKSYQARPRPPPSIASIENQSKRLERIASECAYRSLGSSFVFQRHSRARIRVKGAFSH